VVSGESFESVLRQVIECGGDTDTFAAITGQIIGAALGELCLPAKLVDRLPEAAGIRDIAVEFAASASAG
jgi:ADP-ribosylglycohydrolase